MNDSDAADIISALGNEKRLQVFRLLVRAGRDGLNVGDIQLRTAIPASTLAHHVSTLTRTGLISKDRVGRETICRANYETMETVFSFMTEQCCAGVEPLADAG